MPFMSRSGWFSSGGGKSVKGPITNMTRSVYPEQSLCKLLFRPACTSWGLRQPLSASGWLKRSWGDHRQGPCFPLTSCISFHCIPSLNCVSQSCLTLCNPMGCSPPGSSAHGILQARILEWVAMPFSRGSSRPRDWTQDSCPAGRFITVWATRGAPHQNTPKLSGIQTSLVVQEVQCRGHGFNPWWGS